MSKLTKKEYNHRLDVLEARIDYYKNLISQYEQIPEGTPEYYKIGDKWNEAHDMIYDLEKEIRFLEDAWDKRNWTFSDHMEWELVRNNID